MTDHPAAAPMTRTEAAAALGVPPDADDATVSSAFRRRALQAHPDRGGDPAEFERSVAARKLLLGDRAAGSEERRGARQRVVVRRRSWWRPWN